jgi:hypothetical protein
MSSIKTELGMSSTLAHLSPSDWSLKSFMGCISYKIGRKESII